MHRLFGSLALTAGLILTGSTAEAQTQLAGVPADASLSSVVMVRTPSVQLLPTTPLAYRVTTVPREPARSGSMTCRVEENGVVARASFQLLASGRTVATGDCGQPIDVPAGTYQAVLTLETTVDRPQRSVQLTVPSGGSARATASFSTSTLEVRFTKDRRAVHGLAEIRRDGRTIATLGSGVSARLSSGSYEIVTRYRTEVRRYTVTLAPGQRRALRADF